MLSVPVRTWAAAPITAANATHNPAMTTTRRMLELLAEYGRDPTRSRGSAARVARRGSVRRRQILISRGSLECAHYAAHRGYRARPATVVFDPAQTSSRS